MRIPECIKDVVRCLRCARSARLFRDTRAFALLFLRRPSSHQSSRALSVREVTVHPKAARGFPIALRTGTTDIASYREAFIVRYHMPQRLKPDVATILDLGANIGLVSLDLAKTFPDSRIVSVELDRSNYELLCRNVAFLSDRVMTVHAAVWSHSAGVSYSLDREENAFAVGVTANGAQLSASVPSFTPPELIALFHRELVDYVKMDIEGGEHELLLTGDTAWLERVEAISVEIHRDAWTDDIAGVLRDAGFAVRRLVKHWNSLEAYRY